MLHWSVEKLNKNHYMVKSKDNDSFIEVKLNSNWDDDPEILLTNTKDMSDDFIMLYPQTYQTLPEDDPIIGEAFRYDGLKCIGSSLIDATIISTNIPSRAKGSIELLCI